MFLFGFLFILRFWKHGARIVKLSSQSSKYNIPVRTALLLDFIVMASHDPTATMDCPLNARELTISISHADLNNVALKVKDILKELLRFDSVIRLNHRGHVNLRLADWMDKDGGTITYIRQRLSVTAARRIDLLQTTIHALVRMSVGKLPEGETKIKYVQEERILLLDIARKYYSIDAILMLLDFMCLAQFNYLQLHFSDNEGFGIETTSHPEILSGMYLTKTEVMKIIEYAARCSIEIIPELDSPGHLRAVLRQYPEYTLPNEISSLNVLSSNAINFIMALYIEFALLFEASTYFHLGGDEFVRNLNDDDIDEIMNGFVSYINYVADQLVGWGFIPRVWNDGFFYYEQKYVPSQKIQITYWTNDIKNHAPLGDFVRRGYTVINHNADFFYYVLGESGFRQPTYDNIIINWEPTIFSGYQALEEITPQFPGVAVSVWADFPDEKTEEDIVIDVFFLLFAVMQKITSNVFLDHINVKNVLFQYRCLGLNATRFQNITLEHFTENQEKLKSLEKENEEVEELRQKMKGYYGLQLK